MALWISLSLANRTTFEEVLVDIHQVTHMTTRKTTVLTPEGSPAPTAEIIVTDLHMSGANYDPVTVKESPPEIMNMANDPTEILHPIAD